MKKEFTSLILVGLTLLVTLTVSVAALALPYTGKVIQDTLSYGTVASIQQTDEIKSPTWILSGHWATNLINKTKSDFNQTNPAKFDATFTMVMLNGSARHQHHISNYSLTDINTKNDTTTYRGLATITMKAGPVENVPLETKLIKNNVISLWFDPSKVQKHFGDSPIYGTVLTKKDIESNESKVSK